MAPSDAFHLTVRRFDTSINYSKLAKAHHYLTTPTKDGSKVHFILTNSDSTFPAGGQFYPGSGAISAPLRYSTGLVPMECGKPEKVRRLCSPWLARARRAFFRLTPSLCCCVGSADDDGLHRCQVRLSPLFTISWWPSTHTLAPTSPLVLRRHFDLSRTVMVGDRLNTDIEVSLLSLTALYASPLTLLISQTPLPPPSSSAINLAPPPFSFSLVSPSPKRSRRATPRTLPEQCRPLLSKAWATSESWPRGSRRGKA